LATAKAKHVNHSHTEHFRKEFLFNYYQEANVIEQAQTAIALEKSRQLFAVSELFQNNSGLSLP